MLIAVFYQLLLIIGHSILLGRFKLGDEFLGISGEDAKFSGYQYDEEFILGVIHE